MSSCDYVSFMQAIRSNELRELLNLPVGKFVATVILNPVAYINYLDGSMNLEELRVAVQVLVSANLEIIFHHSEYFYIQSEL